MAIPQYFSRNLPFVSGLLGLNYLNRRSIRYPDIKNDFNYIEVHNVSGNQPINIAICD